MQWSYLLGVWPALPLLCWLTGFGTYSGWWVTLLLAPGLEELVVRWGVQESLLRWGVRPAWACVGAALVFALAHGLARSWWLALWVLLPGWILAWLYQRFGRLWICVLVHVAMNVVWHSGWPGMLFLRLY
jgi:membrane protease YdiL (CAAX protease family)